MLRKVLLFTTLCLLLVLLPTFAQAASITRLYVWDGDVPLGESNKLPHDAIQWHKSGSARYLYLPSGMDASNLRVYFTGVKSFKVGDRTINNGDVTDVFVPGETVVLKTGKTSCKVTVIQSQNTASVFFRTKTGGISYIAETKKNRDPGSISVYAENGQLSYHSDFEYIRVRGNTSFYPAKKSFQIKLNEGASLLGMDKGKTWLLIASHKDNSMLRNAITLEMAAAAGNVYTPGYRFVTVYANSLYYGVYLMTEKIQINNGRVSITDLEEATEKLNKKALEKYSQKGTRAYKRDTIMYSDIPKDPEDVTGGYLLQLQQATRYKQCESGFVTSHGQAVEITSPKYASKAQTEYIRDVMQSFENAIWAEDGVDPVTGRHYTEIADMDSMVSKYLIEEITKNLDANKNSFYVYKDSDKVDGKLYFGPVWDYDNGYANYNTPDYDGYLLDPRTLHAATDPHQKYYFFPNLYKHEDFLQAVKDAYVTRFRPCLEVLLDLREPSAATGNLISLSDYEEMLTPAAAQNFSRWRSFNEFHVKTGKDYPENIQYLRTFLTERMSYLDSLWLD